MGEAQPPTTALGERVPVPPREALSQPISAGGVLAGGGESELSPQRRGPFESSDAFRYAARSSVGLANVAERLDELLYRRRLIVLTLGAGVVEGVFRLQAAYYAWALAGYATIIYLLGLARVWSLRDDEGAWSWPHTLERMSAATRGAFIGIWEIGTGGDLLRVLSSASIGGGLVAVAVGRPVLVLLLGSPVAAARSEFLAYAYGVFWSGVAVRVAMVVHARRSQVQSSIAAIASEWSAHGELPAVVDVWSLREGDALLSATGTGPVFEALRSWKPKGCYSESDYEESLKRHLKRNISADIEQQRPLHREGGQRPFRLDLVIADCVALELKRGMASSDADRAVGQLWKYADLWSGGPVILVLCETRKDFADSPAVRHIAALKEAGKAVLVVAAGRRLG